MRKKDCLQSFFHLGLCEVKYEKEEGCVSVLKPMLQKWLILICLIGLTSFYFCVTLNAKGR